MWLLGLISFIVTPFVLMLVHEGGHALAAGMFGYFIDFKFIPLYLLGIPVFFRGVWSMPAAKRWKQYVIAMSGFGFEFAVGIVLALCYQMFGVIFLLLAVVHIALYPFYCGENNDFNVFKEDYDA